MKIDVDAWLRLWSSYDLTLVEQIFLPDDRLTYFSSEKEGLLQGLQAVREHHRAFGFVPGGRAASSLLRLEGLTMSEFDKAAIVSATWHFSRPGSPKSQKGPVTLVYVPYGDGSRIAHAHFANYRAAGPD